MTDPLTPDEGTKPLRTKLKAGVDDKYDIHGSDATSVKLNWTTDFKESVRNMASSAEFWSQTECEMILIGEAISQASQFMKDTGIGWLYPMKKVMLSTEHGSSSRASALASLKGGEAYLGSLHVDEHNDVEYRPKALKKDNRKLNTDVEDFGITKRDRIILGLSVIIVENQELFLPGAIDEAKNVKRVVRPQINNIKPQAISFVRDMASVARDAEEEGELYEGEFNKTLESMRAKFPEAYETFTSEYEQER